jgi:hypothetical protein
MPFTSQCPSRRSKRLIDETGKRYGVVTVIERASNDGRGSARWRVRCDECAAVHVLLGTAMRQAPPSRCPALAAARRKDG